MTGIEEVADVVTVFRGAFSVIFALALAEGFKQSVHDKAEKETDRVLYPEKVIGLLSFLLLILPFYQGTMRIYSHFYGDAKSLEPLISTTRTASIRGFGGSTPGPLT